MTKVKKKVLILIIVIAVVVVIAVGAIVGYNIYRFPARFLNLSDKSLSAEETERLRATIAEMEDKDVLVAYLSYSGTTRGVASEISRQTNADLFEIAPKTAYSNVYTQSNGEIRHMARPELSQKVDNIEKYEIVFVGYPVWWHATPAPINTFLESYDLTGKLIIPFCTSGGSDIEETMPTFLDSCDGLAVYGQRRIISSNQINGWLDDLALNL